MPLPDLPPAPLAVVAMGGHAFIQPGEPGTHEDHVRNARVVARQLIKLLGRGYNLVITHGNGPQVGRLMTRNELTRDRLDGMPIDVLVAETEGSLGYILQNALLNELRRQDIRRYVVTMVTQVLIDAEDPRLLRPTKPVGPFLGREEAEQRREQFGWVIREEPNRGWRRVVPSPRPVKIVQRHMVKEAATGGHIVIAGGGGGIPIVRGESGDYEGIEAVIDKDLTSSVLATDVGADLLIILTAVDGVYLNFGQPDELRLGAVTLAECDRYVAAGHFPEGSMGPKIEAVHGFLKRGGRRALITRPDLLEAAMDGSAGTHFVGRI